MDKRDKEVKDAVDFLSNFEVLLPCKGSPLYGSLRRYHRWVKKEEDMGDMGNIQNDIDSRLIDYAPEGGCPSRFCYPKGYHRAKERKVTMNMAGATYDGIANREKEYLSELPPHVLKLMVAIEERKK